MVAESVEEPEDRKEEREHVSQIHGHQNEIGRRPHVLLWQDEDHQHIGDDSHNHQERHYVTAEGKGVANVQIRRDVHVRHKLSVSSRKCSLMDTRGQIERHEQFGECWAFSVKKKREKDKKRNDERYRFSCASKRDTVCSTRFSSDSAR